MTENSDKIIKTIGENGEELYMKILEIVEVNNQEYAIISVIPDPQNVPEDYDIDDPDDILVMRLISAGDEYSFEVIDNDDEFEEVVRAISDDDEYEITKEEISPEKQSSKKKSNSQSELDSAMQIFSQEYDKQKIDMDTNFSMPLDEFNEETDM